MFSLLQLHIQTLSGELGDSGRLTYPHSKVHTAISCVCTPTVAPPRAVYGPSAMAALLLLLLQLLNYVDTLSGESCAPVLSSSSTIST